MEKELKDSRALLAAARKAQVLAADTADGMEFDGAAESTTTSKDENSAKRTELQENINIHERMLKDLTTLGQDEGEMARIAKAELGKLREQVKSLKSPVTAHKQALQKLERVRVQASKGRKEVEDMEKKLVQLQSDIQSKKAFVESKDTEIVALEQQVAQHAAKLQGAKEVFTPLPPAEDLFAFDVSAAEFQGEGAEAQGLRGFVDQLAGNANWPKVQAMLHKQIQAKLGEKLDAPAAGGAPPPRQGAAADAEREAGAAAVSGDDGNEKGKRPTDFLLDKQEIETLWASMHDSESGDISVNKEQFEQMVKNVQNTKHRRLSDGGVAKTGGTGS